VDRAAVERVVRAAAAARVAPADEPVLAEQSRSRSIRVWSAVGIAAAAAIIGFVARGAWTGQRTARVQEAATIAAPTRLPALQAAATSDVAAIPEQFVFEDVKAKRISLVGDFNKWDPSVTPMVKSGTGLWSVIVPILPGRHTYGFMVDDSVFTLDPRAQKARDPDLGTEGSVRMVGRP
jgi:hypothetical protein